MKRHHVLAMFDILLDALIEEDKNGAWNYAARLAARLQDIKEDYTNGIGRHLPVATQEEVHIANCDTVCTSTGHKMSGYIAAIKCYRDRTGLDLRSCKKVIDEVRTR